MTAQQPRQRFLKAGAVALSLAAHCAILMLTLLAAGGGKPVGSPPKPALLIALEQGQPPRAAAETPAHPAPRPAARRKPRAARPEPAAPAGTDTATPQQLPQPELAAAASTDQARPEAPQPPAAGAEVPTAGEPPPLLYLAEVSRLIRLRLDEPARARLDRTQGTVVVRILLARDGTVLSAEVIQGAGHPALDEEARQVVLRIHKFPELPGYYARGEQRFAIDQPIAFRGG